MAPSGRIGIRNPEQFNRLLGLISDIDPRPGAPLFLHSQTTVYGHFRSFRK
jgi:hypothetical protein